MPKQASPLNGHLLWDLALLTPGLARSHVSYLNLFVQEVLRSSWLPRLASMGDPNLWLHFAEQAVKFEHDLAPLRGLPLPPEANEGVHTPIPPSPPSRGSSSKGLRSGVLDLQLLHMRVLCAPLFPMPVTRIAAHRIEPGA